MCLVDLSSNLRLQVWQSRAKDAEKKLNETSDILSVDNENSTKAVSRLHDNDEILSQPSTTLSDAVYGGEDGKVDGGNSEITIDDRKINSRRFRRNGLLGDESSEDARGFPVWSDD